MSVNHENPLMDLDLLAPVLSKYSGRQRDALLPMLQDSQKIYGWLPRKVQIAIGETLRVPLAEVHGVIEFYSMFYNMPTGRQVIRVCEDIACDLAGSEALFAGLRDELGLVNGLSDLKQDITIEKVPCLGLCDKAPAVLNGETSAGKLSVGDLPSFIGGKYASPVSQVMGNPRLILSRVGQVDPKSLHDYQSTGGYQVLDRMLAMQPDEIIKLIDQVGIVGRGGAMFPLGQKWRFTRFSDNESKYVVVNADESEPGTFKDRVIMEGDPFAVIEATTIAAHVIGADKGWIFVRGEYPDCYKLLLNAVSKAREAGYLGRDIGGQPGFDFDIEVRLGAGAYICGEETALFEAIEGKRGFPRIKPPYPTTSGLFGRPTTINNVETLAAGLTALSVGLDEWRKYGTKESPGTKLFCLSGHVSRPGVYEIPFGKSVRQMIDLAGGTVGGREVKAVLIGGSAGKFIGPEMLDLPLTYEDSKRSGIPLGSGVIMVFNDQTDMRDVFRLIGQFFAHESCGKCYPCQLGTMRQLEILERIAQTDGAKNTDKKTLSEIGYAMSETSLCGLGMTAGSAIMSAIELWPELFE